VPRLPRLPLPPLQPPKLPRGPPPPATLRTEPLAEAAALLPPRASVVAERSGARAEARRRSAEVRCFEGGTAKATNTWKMRGRQGGGGKAT
jgi:hypothetical protein